VENIINADGNERGRDRDVLEARMRHEEHDGGEAETNKVTHHESGAKVRFRVDEIRWMAGRGLTECGNLEWLPPNIQMTPRKDTAPTARQGEGNKICQRGNPKDV